jgi:multiple antibiotic resistance protein
LKEQIQAIVTVLSLVNPTICGMMFVQAEAGRSRGGQLIDATKAALTILVILTASALVGTKLLHLFGVSLDAFMVAGGGVLAWMGFPCSAASRLHQLHQLSIRTRIRRSRL